MRLLVLAALVDNAATLLVAPLAAAPRAAAVPVRMSESVASAVGITPIGPFCPFRSEACGDGGLLESGMAALSAKAPLFMTELSRLQLSMQAGSEVDADRVKAVAADMTATQSEWEGLLTRMGVTDDFQAREYKKMTCVQQSSNPTHRRSVSLREGGSAGHGGLTRFGKENRRFTE